MIFDCICLNNKALKFERDESDQHFDLIKKKLMSKPTQFMQLDILPFVSMFEILVTHHMVRNMNIGRVF